MTITHTDYPMGRVRRIHFVGIGGAGMSGIAEVLLNLGYQITGSDQKASPATERLQTLGATITLSHDAANAVGADVVVQSSAIDETNPEINYAKQQRIPVIKRGEMLAELMRFRQGIAIAGTHGKTTTTSLTASVLSHGQLDPTFVIGGRLNSAGANAYLGKSQYFVAEADESDASFLHLMPVMAVVTNIDRDHLENYVGDFAEYQQTFLRFLHHLPFYGLAIMCIDDPVVRNVLPGVARHVITYGFSDDADVRITAYQQHGTASDVTINGGTWTTPFTFTVNLPGKHNALNAVAAAIIANQCGVTNQAISAGLQQFAGVGRRFQVYGNVSFADKTVLLVDDYGHHPRELAATIAAAKQAWPSRRLTMLFQPHRYTRTHDLFNEFVDVLTQVDALFLLDVYSAGETPIAGADSAALCAALIDAGQLHVTHIADQTTLNTVLEQQLQADDVLLTQGAGSVGHIATQLYQYGCDKTVSSEKV